MPDIEIVELSSRRLVGMTTETSMESIGDDIGGLAEAVAETLGPDIAGPCVTHYLSWVGDAGEILVGFPTSADAPEGCIVDELPAGRAAVYLHVGGYEGLAAAWGAIRAGMAEQGLTGRATPWEEYLNDCSVTPKDELQTRIVWPIE